MDKAFINYHLPESAYECQELILNQARAGHRPARALFLIITFIPPKYVCVCVYAPETMDVILILDDWLNNCVCISVPFYGSCHRCHHIGMPLVTK